MKKRSQARPHDLAKRLIDIVGSSLGLLVTAPLQAIVAVAIARSLGRPVLFRQSRPGKDGDRFVLVKFRTMVDADPSRGLITDADRLTSLGSKLRATSLDELPTLWNVLVGDMSLVGPRPLLTQYLERYTPQQARRHEVRPGITGLAQVRGRNLLSWDEKFAADVFYIENRSLRLDLLIIGRTFAAVLRRRGITTETGSAMPEFRGDLTT